MHRRKKTRVAAAAAPAAIPLTDPRDATILGCTYEMDNTGSRKQENMPSQQRYMYGDEMLVPYTDSPSQHFSAQGRYPRRDMEG
jgi:hypothetical protein